jgi:hypothetical protein
MNLQISSLGSVLCYRLCGIKNENIFIFYTAARAAGQGLKGPKGGKANEPMANRTERQNLHPPHLTESTEKISGLF